MMKTAADLSILEQGKIISIDLEENKHFKAIHLGVIKDNIITCVFKSPLKDPIAYQINGCVFALRNEDAQKIMVKTNE